MRIGFVGDGKRDHHTIPRLMERILGAEVEQECCRFQSWKNIRLNRGRGYGKKLKFAVRQARDAELDGVVATIDADRANPGERLKTLIAARQEDRQDPALTLLPTALGEAVPHLEAWLLDDQPAVRQVLHFSADKQLPNVRDVDPKAAMDELIDESDSTQERLHVLGQIASDLQLDRCNHKDETGLQAFCDNLVNEFGHEAN